MKLILMVSMLLPLANYAMDEEEVYLKELSASILADKQKTPQQRMKILHNQVIRYYQDQAEKGQGGIRCIEIANRPTIVGTLPNYDVVNDACDKLSKENSQVDLSAYRSGGDEFLKAVMELLMK